jgi:NAD(P)-dependent dehydrogenase (short-subunit alcohol dehydrogenase family)
LDLTGRIALVTGAAHGIGKAIGQALHAAGATVVLADVNEAMVKQTAAALGARGIRLDVSDEQAVDAAVNAIVAEHGGLDIAVNNAGVYREYGGPVAEMPTEKWRGLMSVNLDGVFYCCRAEARAMIARGKGGRIINIASTQAVTPGVGVNYDGSKAAVHQMTRTMALELAPHGINVNAIAPGATWVVDAPAPQMPRGMVPPASGKPLDDQVASRISRIPLGRWGTPDEVGRAAVFLSSGMSDYITGVYLPVDGGWLVL